MSEHIKVFAPATIANVACGFDIMGLALEEIGDTLTIHKTNTQKLEIGEILGADNLPTSPEKNVCTVAVQALLDDLGSKQGFIIDIEKNVSPGSGLGSSASSAAGAVYGANELLGKPYQKDELVKFAMEGEKAASEKAHADNVAPSLLGGFTVVRSYDPLDIFNLNYPDELYAAVIFPAVEVRTADAKKILRSEVSLSDAIRQWGNVSALTAGLIMEDFDLIKRSLEDVIVEPVRSMLIPCYQEMKNAGLAAGALGGNISGSGPSVFTLNKGEEIAKKAGRAMGKVLEQNKIDYQLFVSKINPKGCVTVEAS